MHLMQGSQNLSSILKMYVAMNGYGFSIMILTLLNAANGIYCRISHFEIKL